MEGGRAQKRVRFDVPGSDGDREGGGGGSVRVSLEGEDVGRRCSLGKERQGIEKLGDEGGSEDDCEWSVDLEGEGW